MRANTKFYLPFYANRVLVCFGLFELETVHVTCIPATVKTIFIIRAICW